LAKPFGDDDASVAGTVKLYDSFSSIDSLSLSEDVAILEKSAISLGRLLGKGSFCEVAVVKSVSLGRSPTFSTSVRDLAASCEDFDGQAQYAVKKLRSDLSGYSTQSNNEMPDILAEAHILSQIHHPHVVELRGITVTGCCLVLDRLVHTLPIRLKVWQSELCHARTPLAKVRLGAKQRRRDFLRRRLIHARNLASALAHIHEKNIVHRDLKPANIGFDTHGDIQIFDFGLSRELPRVDPGEEAFLYSNAGSLPYMAPEVAHSKPHNQSADVFSFSIVLWQMITGKTHPYPNATSSKNLIRHVFQLHKRPRCKGKTWAACHPLLQDLVQDAWATNPYDRPSMQEMYGTLREVLYLEESSEGSF
jgi:serine/threonine protein kinase